MNLDVERLKCADCAYWRGAVMHNYQKGVCARYPEYLAKDPEGEACGEHPEAATQRAHDAAETFIYASFVGGYPLVTVDRANHNR